MKSSQIRLFVILAAFIYFGYADASCRFYEEELAVNQTWESCKALCAQKNGSCLAWAHNIGTKRCAGWILETRSETRENDMYYPAASNGAEGSVVAKDKEEGYSKDDDARASGPSQDDVVFDFDDDQESTAEAYYSDFYNVQTGSGGTESDDDEDTTTQNYYNAFYNVQTRSGGGESDDDDEDTTTQDYYSAFYNVQTRSGGGESDDDDEDSTAQEYYSDFYNTPAGSVRTKSDDDDESYGGYDYDYDTSTSSSSSVALQANTTSGGLKEQKSDPPIHALVEKYRSLNRGPLYDQCEVIATVSFITPVNSVSSTMSDCFFQKLELINSTTKEQCNAVCQNLHSSANASCIAWMWRAEEQDCVGLALTVDSNYSFCGLP